MRANAATPPQNGSASVRLLVHAPSASAPNGAMKVAFLHPDLGVGGAERLVVDAAVGLKRLGHEVHFYTYYHSPSHCFPETKDGTVPVTVWYAPALSVPLSQAPWDPPPPRKDWAKFSSRPLANLKNLKKYAVGGNPPPPPACRRRG